LSRDVGGLSGSSNEITVHLIAIENPKNLFPGLDVLSEGLIF
jgi:hypothetical protein